MIDDMQRLLRTCSNVRAKVRAIPYSSLKQKRAIEEVVEELNDAIDKACVAIQDLAQSTRPASSNQSQ